MADRILVVDDEKTVLEALVRSLELEGYSVEGARNATEALVKCDDHFDLVILDFIMPGMNGIELLARIRQKIPTIRSIVLSGKLPLDSDEKQIAADLNARVEADEYLHKPVGDQKLVATVKALLAKDPTDNWQEIARRVTDGKKSRLAEARDAARSLKQMRKKHD